MELVSIIIPIYNKALYLERCFKSLDCQTYRNLEIIMIDDGSTDESLKKCEEYGIESEYQCKIISQTNLGPSKARNVGLSLATGNYILFLDADDFLNRKCVEICLELAKKTNADVIEFNYAIKEETLSANYFTYCFVEHNEIIGNLLKEKFIHPLIWTCFYRHESIRKIRFNEQITWGEDRCYKLDVCMKAQKIVYIEQPLYINCVEPNTLSRMEVSEDILKSVGSMLNYYIESLKGEKEFEHLLKKMIFNHAFSYMSLIVIQGNYSHCKSGYQWMEEFCKKFFYHADIKHKIAYILIKNKGLYSFLRRIADRWIKMLRSRSI